MKTIPCQHCTEEVTAASKEESLNQLYTHYMKNHHAIITNVDEAGKNAFMQQFEADWNSALEQ